MKGLALALGGGLVIGVVVVVVAWEAALGVWALTAIAPLAFGWGWFSAWFADKRDWI
jgi:hypothetical protein